MHGFKVLSGSGVQGISDMFKMVGNWNWPSSSWPPAGPSGPPPPLPCGDASGSASQTEERGGVTAQLFKCTEEHFCRESKGRHLPTEAKPSASAREVLVMWETRSLLFLEGWQVGSHTRGGTRDLCSYGPQCHWRAPQSLEREENRRKKNRKKRGNLIEKDLFIKKLWIELHPSNLASVMASQPAMHLEGNMSLI